MPHVFYAEQVAAARLDRARRIMADVLRERGETTNAQHALTGAYDRGITIAAIIKTLEQ